jgi:hypothetical protein
MRYALHMSYRAGVPLYDLDLHRGSSFRTVKAVPIPSWRISREAMGLGAAPVASQLGRIRTADGWSYQITPEDALWLARSIQYEGGNKNATLWTYAQRLANRQGSNLASLVRAHSQPVNPIWASMSGSGCVAHPDRCTPSQLARRQEAASRSWDSLPSAPTVLRWAQARTPNAVPRATDFADATVSASFMRRNPQSRIVMRDGNWYLSEGGDSAPRGGSIGWPENYVTIEHEGHTAQRSVFAGVPSWVPWVVAGGGGALLMGGLAIWAARQPKLKT